MKLALLAVALAVLQWRVVVGRLVDSEDPCVNVRCPELACSSGQVWKPEGKCCSECADPCLSMTCPEFTKCTTNEFNTNAWCEETCDNNGKCATDEVCEIVTDLTLAEGCAKKTVCKSLHHCKVTPTTIEDFCFSWDGTDRCERKGMSFCTHIDVKDHFNDPWSKVYICSCKDYGMRWSNYGPITGMKCTGVSEPLKNMWGLDRYLCVPLWWSFSFAWSHNGIPTGVMSSDCMEWTIPGDGFWNENHLCKVNPPGLLDFKFSNDGPITDWKCYKLWQSVTGHTFTGGWDNNYLCSRRDFGLWVNFGAPVDNMWCTRLTRCNMTSWWSDPYVCSPYWWGWSAEWHSWGTPHNSWQCVDFEEPEDTNFFGALCRAKNCPVTDCQELCPTGYIFDESGCKTCKCRPDHCAFVSCPTTACKNFWWKIGDCCPTCLDGQIKETTCPAIHDCSWRCPYGFKKDVSGCELCECRENPCNTHTCFSYEDCVVDPITFEPFCQDTCRNNGPCKQNERCVMKMQPCWRAPCWSIATCEPIVSAEWMNCNMTCPGGVRFWKETQSCSCKPDHCIHVECPATPMCDFPVYVGDECCPRCRPVCPQTTCTHACPFGYELDLFGCQTCTCKPDTCWDVSCPELTCVDKVNVFGECCMKCKTDVSSNCPLLKCISCPSGYYTDFNGCPTCTCKPDHCSMIECPVVTCMGGEKPIYKTGSCCATCPDKVRCPKTSCDTFCPGGYEYDTNGCMMCKCKPDYCQTVRCVPPTECTNPVYVHGKCCPVCSKADPMVAFNCDHLSKFWDLRVGRWVNNINSQSDCKTDETEILNHCRATYPGMVFWRVQQSKETVTIKDWCDISTSFNTTWCSTNGCTKTYTSWPWHCIGAELQWPVDFHFGWEDFGRWDQSGWHCEVIRPDSGLNTQNYFCSRFQMPFRWSHTGPIDGMQCTKIAEPLDTEFSWTNTYICFPPTFEYRFQWFHDGLPDGWSEKECMRWTVMVDGQVAEGWDDNWLCSDTYKWENFKCDKFCSFGFKTNTVAVQPTDPTHFCECNKDPCTDFECKPFQKCTWDQTTGWPFCIDTCEHNGGCDATEVCELRTTSCFSEPCPWIAVCKPRCPIFKTCSLSCPGGFIEDFNGCPMCKCRPVNCSNVNCLCPTCDKPVIIEGECCPVCPAQCKWIQVTKTCPGGYEMDEWGCYIDSCKPDNCATATCLKPSCTHPINMIGECCPMCSDDHTHTCPDLTCTTVCAGGYYKDRWGCDTCTCKPDHCAKVRWTPTNTCFFIKPGQCTSDCKQDFCPHRSCNKFCRNGFETDINGCPLCKCKPAFCSTWKHEIPTCDHPVSLTGKCGLHCPTLSRAYRCPELFCTNPVYVNGQPCPRCPSRCRRDIRCETPCPSGYDYDRLGCMTCRCKPNSCIDEKCDVTDCKFPVWKAGSCCPVCEDDCDKSTCTDCPSGTTAVNIKGSCCPHCTVKKMKIPYICPAVWNCKNACPGGYEFDFRGCPTCTCKPDKCRGVRCPTLYKCDYPVHYEGECCKRCPSQFRYEMTNSPFGRVYKRCSKLKCAVPVFVKGQECPVCPMRTFFPVDFRFIPSFQSMRTSANDFHGWEKLTMLWEHPHEISYMMTTMPTGMQWSNKGPIQGMRCTYIGMPKDTHAEKMTWLCVPEWSHVYTTFYWNVTEAPVAASWCLKIHKVNPSWPVSWLCRDDTQMFWPIDFYFSYSGSDYWTDEDWTCLAITPGTTSYGWDDNFMCMRKDLGWRWSNEGPIEGMTCTHMVTDATSWGENNYLCVPETSEWEVLWSTKWQRGMECMQWKEPKHNSWGEHYICLYKKVCRDSKRQFLTTCPLNCVNSFGYKLDQDGCPICQCRTDPVPCKDKFCPFGFKKDEFGTDTCECRWWSCPNMDSCDITCENGFEYSTLTGCAICKCKPTTCTWKVLAEKWRMAKMNCNSLVTLTGKCDYECPIDYSPSSWCASGRCPVLTCKDPVKVDGECCPKCKPVCTQVQCTKACIHGFQQDVFGCPTCTCNPHPISSMWWLTGCPVRNCKTCVAGYYSDKNGCQTCKCKPAKCATVSCPIPTCSDPIYKAGSCCAICQEVECPEVLCKKTCPTGNEYDEEGCRTCNCKPSDWTWWQKRWSGEEFTLGRWSDDSSWEGSRYCTSDWWWRWWKNDAWWWRSNALSWRKDTWWWKWWQTKDCDNPVSVWNQHEPYCPWKQGVCPKITCSNFCPTGYVKDIRGCHTCRCEVPPLFRCPTTTCDLTCEDGYETDAHGCDVCQCKTVKKVPPCPARCTYDFCSKNLHSFCSINEEDLDNEYKTGRCSSSSSCCVTSCKACHFGTVPPVTDRCTRCNPDDVECIFRFGHCARNHWCRGTDTIDSTTFPCVRFGERGTGQFRCAFSTI